MKFVCLSDVHLMSKCNVRKDAVLTRGLMKLKFVFDYARKETLGKVEKHIAEYRKKKKNNEPIHRQAN